MGDDSVSAMSPQVAPHVVPLTPALLDTYLEFFEGEAFADNPGWASCYCQHPLEDHDVVDWDARTAPQNRALACDRIRSGVARGFLALRDGEPVGWLSAGPRVGYPTLADATVAEAAQVGSIVCFVVAPSARRQGVARALLDAALADFASRGLAVAEGYPRPAASGTAANYHGPVALYEAAGFAPHREDDGVLTVRLDLAGR